MSYQNILVETKGRVGIIRLNRPQVLNALNRALVAELNAAVAAFDADTNIGCILVTGSEKAFAAGRFTESEYVSRREALVTELVALDAQAPLATEAPRGGDR
mgnify:CR=1 FL=1